MGKALVIKNVDFSENAVAHIDIEENVPCTGLSLSISSQSVDYVGDTLTITATKTPIDTTDALVFTSSDENIAKVSSDGTVTVIGIGQATITGVCGSATATVTVNQSNSIKAGNLYNVSGRYPSRVSSDNNAASLFSSSSQRTIGVAYDGNANLKIRGGSTSGVQIIPIPYGANYMQVHTYVEGAATGYGRQVLFDIENLTSYEGDEFATFLTEESDKNQMNKREIYNHAATGILVRHEGTEGTDTYDYIEFFAS